MRDKLVLFYIIVFDLVGKIEKVDYEMEVLICYFFQLVGCRGEENLNQFCIKDFVWFLKIWNLWNEQDSKSSG